MPANRPPGGFVSGDARINRNGPIGNHGLKFAERVRAATKDGQDNVDFAVNLRDGKVLDDVVVDGAVTQVVPPAAVRLKAAMWLTERGLGKSPDVILDEQDTAGMGEDELLASIVDTLPAQRLAYLQDRILRRQKAQGAQQ